MEQLGDVPPRLMAGEVMEAVADREDFTYTLLSLREDGARTVLVKIDSGPMEGQKYRVTVDKVG